MMNQHRKLVIDGDVARGLREIGAELAVGRGGLFIGRGPGGFALIAGAVGQGVVHSGHGSMVAVSLTEAGLRALVDRAQSLLGEDRQATLPDGLVLG